MLVAIPIGAVALMTRRQLHRTEGAPPLARLGWALLVAVPFALLMLVFAVAAGDSVDEQLSPSVGGAFALGLLWGVVGALIGAAKLVPAPLGAAAADACRRRSRRCARWPRSSLVCTVIGLVGWLVQVAADAGEVRVGRSAPTALLEETAFAGRARRPPGRRWPPRRGFRADGSGALGLPFPVDDPNDVPGPDGAFRIFSYNDVLPAASSRRR